jgi:Cft2 family RNA processing exonuclease
VLAPFAQVPLVATPATLALLDLFFTDALRVVARQASRQDMAPPYTRPLVAEMLARSVPLTFGQRYPLQSASINSADSWSLTLFRAGHLLGAAMVLLETPEGTILITGDICRAPLRTVQRALPPRGHSIDALVLESTFGHQTYHPSEVAEARLIALVQRALADGGHVLIACSAIGPAQELLVILAAARVRGDLASDVWIDGSIRGACALYADYAPREHSGLARFISQYGSPFAAAGGLIRAVRDRTDQQALLEGPPSVVISTSPTLRSGPSAFYARHLARQARHLILLPTPDVRFAPLQQLQARCTIEEYSLRLHATRDELAKLAEQLAARQNILIHGSRQARQQLGAVLIRRGLSCIIPDSSGPPIELPETAPVSGSCRQK